MCLEAEGSHKGLKRESFQPQAESYYYLYPGFQLKNIQEKTTLVKLITSISNSNCIFKE